MWISLLLRVAVSSRWLDEYENTSARCDCSSLRPTQFIPSMIRTRVAMVFCLSALTACAITVFITKLHPSSVFPLVTHFVLLSFDSTYLARRLCTLGFLTIILIIRLLLSSFSILQNSFWLYSHTQTHGRRHEGGVLNWTWAEYSLKTPWFLNGCIFHFIIGVNYCIDQPVTVKWRNCIHSCYFSAVFRPAFFWVLVCWCLNIWGTDFQRHEFHSSFDFQFLLQKQSI